MGEVDLNVLVEDIVQFAMRKRNKEWNRTILNIADDDPNFKRMLTPEIGKTIMYFAKQESWSYMMFADILIRSLLTDKMYWFGKYQYYIRDIGTKFLDWNRKETFFSYCGFIVEACCYCLEKGHQSLIETTILASAMALNLKLILSKESDFERYHEYAVQFNKVYEDTFPDGESNLSLEVLCNSL